MRLTVIVTVGADPSTSEPLYVAAENAMDPPLSSSVIDNVADAGAPSTAPTAFDNDSATVSVLSMAASSVIETVNVRTPVCPAPHTKTPSPPP